MRRAAVRQLSDLHRDLHRLTWPLVSTATGKGGEDDDDDKDKADEADESTDEEESFDVWYSANKSRPARASTLVSVRM